MFCTNCGKQIEEGSIFCTYCGTKQTEHQPAPDKPEQETVENVHQAAPAEERVNQEPGAPANEAPAAGTSAEVADADAPAVSEASAAPVTPASKPAPAVSQGSAAPAGISEKKPETPPSTSVNPAYAASETKKSNSSLIVIGIIAVAVIAALFLLFGKGSGFKDYKELVKQYYNAVYKENFNALLKCYDKDDQKDLKEDKEDIEEDLEELKESYDDRFDKGWNKELKVRGKYKTDDDDDVAYYSVAVQLGDEDDIDTLSIKKVKNKYYINADSDSF